MLVVLVVYFLGALKTANEASARAARRSRVGINMIVETVFVGILLAASRALEFRYARLDASVFGLYGFAVVVRKIERRNRSVDMPVIVRRRDRANGEYRLVAEFKPVGRARRVVRSSVHYRFRAAVYRDRVVDRALDHIPRKGRAIIYDKYGFPEDFCGSVNRFYVAFRA